jgi:hypothetical protein
VFFFSNTPVSSTKKTDRHDITEIVLKVALNTIYQPSQPTMSWREQINFQWHDDEVRFVLDQVALNTITLTLTL